MKCNDIMHQNVVTCLSSDEAGDCAKLMDDHNVGFIPVTDASGDVLGTVTDRDLVTRLLAKGKPFSTPLAELMSTDVVSCKPDDLLDVAETKMVRARKSRLVVLDGKKCVGVISLSDIAQAETTWRSGAVLRQITMREAGEAASPGA